MRKKNEWVDLEPPKHEPELRKRSLTTRALQDAFLERGCGRETDPNDDLPQPI
jgi:hypothetical protein